MFRSFKLHDFNPLFLFFDLLLKQPDFPLPLLFLHYLCFFDFIRDTLFQVTNLLLKGYLLVLQLFDALLSVRGNFFLGGKLRPKIAKVNFLLVHDGLQLVKFILEVLDNIRFVGQLLLQGLGMRQKLGNFLLLLSQHPLFVGDNIL